MSSSLKKRLLIFPIIILSICSFLFISGWNAWRSRRSGGEKNTFYHFVEKGDTLHAIAKRYSVSVDEIALLNKLPDPERIYPGQPLLIPLSGKTNIGQEDVFNQYCNFGPAVMERNWQYIIIHHSATPSGSARVFHEFHLNDKGWRNGLGYDFVIGNGTDSPDGAIEVGHRWARQMRGSHVGVGDMNSKGIGICLVGNYEVTNPTEEQWQGLVKLTRSLAKRYNIPEDRIMGHRDVKGASTSCPGRNLSLQELRDEL